MISRRDALKLAASGLVAPVVGMAPSGAISVLAQGTSSVPTFRGNAARTGEMPGPGLSLEKPIILKWHHQAEDWVLSFDVVNDLVILRDYGQNLYAIDSTTGEERWRYVSNDQLSSWVSVNEPLVYVGTQTGGLHTIDVETGNTRWSFPTSGTVNSRPMLADGRVYFGSRDGYFYAIDAASGSELWRFTDSGGFSRLPRIVDGIVYVQSDSYTTYAFDAESGEEYWQFDFGASTGFAQAVGDTFFIAVNVPSHALVAIDSMSGQELWRFPTGQTSTPAPLVNDGAVYFGFGDGEQSYTCAVDTATGKELWRFSHPTNPGETNRDMYVAGSHNGAIFTRAWDENFIALDQSSGQELWRFVVDDAFTNALINGSVGWLGNRNHNLYAIDLTTGGEIFHYQVDDIVADLDLEDDTLFVTSYSAMVHALENIEHSVLRTEVLLRGAPSQTAVERGRGSDGDVISVTGTQKSVSGEDWAEVSIRGTAGWIPLDAIDPATLPPEGDVEVIYTPQ